MNRRSFIAFGGAAIGLPRLVLAQAAKTKRLGFIFPLPQNDLMTPSYLTKAALGLARQKWVDGDNLHIEYRFGANTADAALRALQEVLPLKPDCLLCVPTRVIRQAAMLTDTIPIAFALASDPVGEGWVKSFAHPDRNLTGFSNIGPEASLKWLELLKELHPGAKRAGLLVSDQTDGTTKAYIATFEEAAPRLGLEPVVVAAPTSDQIGSAVAQFAKVPNSGLVVGTDTLLVTNYKTVVTAVTDSRVPTVFGHLTYSAYAAVDYYIDATSVVGGAAEYAGLLLNGANPSDLPVQAPTKYNLTVNLVTATAMGLVVPQSILVRADQVIG